MMFRLKDCDSTGSISYPYSLYITLLLLLPQEQQAFKPTHTTNMELIYDIVLIYYIT